MAYAVRRLTQEKVDKAIKAIDASRKAGQHIKSQLVADGGGLYLKLPQASYTSWLRFGGRRISPGHGSARSIKLAEARDAHEAALRLVRANKNPVTEKLKARTQAAANKTFMEAARAFLMKPATIPAATRACAPEFWAIASASNGSTLAGARRVPTVTAELKSDKTRAVWRAALLGDAGRVHPLQS